jgi:hypothetical protein
MNANRALGLIAALLVTSAQALVMATDTTGPAQPVEHSTRQDSALDTGSVAEAAPRRSDSRAPTGG